MRVSEIKYVNSNVSMALDNGEKLLLSREFFEIHSPGLNHEIDSALYEALKLECGKLKCLKKALDCVGIKNRTSREVSVWLSTRGFQPEDIKNAVEYLIGKGYVNDREYAFNYLKSAFGAKPAGEYLIRNRLMQKGIAQEIISEALEESGILNYERDSLLAFARKKYDSMAASPKRREKTAAYLRGRGFDYSTIEGIINSLDDDK